MATPDERDDETASDRPRLSARAIGRVRSVARAAFDVVLPPLCLGCDARILDHDALCPDCWRGIDFITPPLCDRLGLPLPYGGDGQLISAAAAADPPAYDRARAVARLDGLMRDLVHDLKYRDAHVGRRMFGRWLMEAGRELIAGADLIAATPLARFRLLSRRFNQAQILASEVGRRAGKPMAPDLILRTRNTARQVGLSRLARQRNVSGCFAVAPDRAHRVVGAAILLIDDVITTGATANAVALALKKAGAARVDVLALAIAADPRA